MQQNKQNKEYWPLEEIKEWERNPRKITLHGINRLKKQISELGQYKPLIVNSGKYWGDRGLCAGGNMRIKAFKDLGISSVWVSVVDPRSEEEFLKYALSDNDQVGYYDKDLLVNLIPNFNVDWSDFSVDLKEPINLGELVDSFNKTKEGDNEEVFGDPISCTGEVYQLGRHRLMCGDATKIEDVEKLMGSERADLIFTDPPYNVNYDYTSKFDHIHGVKHSKGDVRFKKIFSDNLSKGDFSEFIDKVVQNLYMFSKDETSYYIWFADKWMPLLRAALEKNGFVYSQTIVWVKENFVIAQSQDYHKMFESCLHGWKKGKKHYFNKIISKSSDVWNLNDNQMLELMYESDLWIVKRDAVVDRQHPTQKPVKLAEMAIKKSSKADDVVLDLFGGSGSTLLACESLNRRCFMMELDPRFCDVIRKRYAKFIGKEEEWTEVTQKID